MSSTNYKVRADSFSVGGSDTASSASYILRDTTGGVSATASSSSYVLQSGYRAGIFDQIITISTGVQEAAVLSTATALSGLVVTVDGTGGLAVDDLIFVVENASTNHDVAVGVITAIAGNNITVDEFVSNTTVTIDGTDDYVYRGSGTSMSYGTLTTNLVMHRLVGWQSFVDVPNGFNVYVSEDTDFTTGSETIADVSDGTVTAGSGEFGARASDTSLSESTFDSADTAITATPQQIASVASSDRRKAKGYLDVKVAASSSQVVGSYANNLLFIVAPIF
ncbi:hypothetical protein HYW18_02550 [Candidatus Uhrbacteria bacterium]|nr:hypothetical protein [Candidatus Uhrbacteria bacterium]